MEDRGIGSPLTGADRFVEAGVTPWLGSHTGDVGLGSASSRSEENVAEGNALRKTAQVVVALSDGEGAFLDVKKAHQEFAELRVVHGKGCRAIRLVRALSRLRTGMHERKGLRFSVRSASLASWRMLW